MVSHRAIKDILQIPWKEMYFFFFLVCCVVTESSLQLMFENMGRVALWVKEFHSELEGSNLTKHLTRL